MLIIRHPGYYGGRWWVAVNEDGYMDAGDLFFLCPLLGPGFAEPVGGFIRLKKP